MASASRKLFLNLPVADLARSMAFFRKLGFAFDPRFTDRHAACMRVGDGCSVMLLCRPFFESFTSKPTSEALESTAAVFALSCESNEEVDAMVHTALAAGGAPAMHPIRHGNFMYGWSFYDLDGHHWEVLHLNPAALQS